MIEYYDNEKLLQDTDVAERAVCLLMDMAQRYVGIRSWLWQRMKMRKIFFVNISKKQ